MCESCNFFPKLCNTDEVIDVDICNVKINSQTKIIQMRKLTISLLTAFMLLTIMPAQVKAGTETSTLSTAAAKTDKTAESAASNALLLRLDNIKAMDKSTLNSSEKQQLRKEVRSIKSQLSEMGGGVYLSVGAILLIVLLLVILL